VQRFQLANARQDLESADAWQADVEEDEPEVFTPLQAVRRPRS